MYLCTHMHSIVIALPARNVNIGLALFVKGINIIKPIVVATCNRYQMD